MGYERISRPKEQIEYNDPMYRQLQKLEDAIENGTLVFLVDRKPLIWGDEWQDTILCPHCGNDLMGGFEFNNCGETEMIQCLHCGGFVFCDRADEYDEARVKELKGE